MTLRLIFNCSVASLLLAGLAYPTFMPAAAVGMAPRHSPWSLDRLLNPERSPPLSLTDGTLKLAGLERQVTVLRDSWGCPAYLRAIAARLFLRARFCVTAQDRLFQMELWKRVGQGRLAEIFGPGYLQRDINARRLAYRGPAAEDFASYADDARPILEAFTQGVNAEIARRSATRRPRPCPWNFSSPVSRPSPGSLRTASCVWPASP